MKVYSSGKTLDLKIPPMSEIDKEIAELKVLEAKLSVSAHRYSNAARECHELWVALERLKCNPIL